QEIFSRSLQPLEHDPGQFWRTIAPAQNPHASVPVWRIDDLKGRRFAHPLNFRRAVLTSNKTLYSINGISRIGDGLTFSYLSHQTLALISETDYAGRRPSAFLIGHNLNRTALEYRDAAIRRSQVYSDSFSH